MNTKTHCKICGEELFFKWKKFSPGANTHFNIYECHGCGLWQIYPLPSQKELNSLYETSYFSKRTERGYNNYAGEEVKKSVRSTFEKNLRDLGFFAWEKNQEHSRNALEIGSASGHFVEYMQERKWNITGLDISETMIKEGQKRGLNVIHGNFLDYSFTETFDLIVLWATLEHLPDPDQYIQKISGLLKPGGRLYCTTANTGFWARINGVNWRYLNVPEHIFYFNRKNLEKLFRKQNMKIKYSFTYGSGFTAKKNATLLYKYAKRFFDLTAKFFHSGDMIAVEVVKI